MVPHILRVGKNDGNELLQFILRIIDRLCQGKGLSGDLNQLKRLSKLLRLTSFCGLGQSVAWPIDSALANFGDELAELSGS